MVPSNHSIDAPCETTDVAQGLIDGITYGKGAAFLRQVIHYVGRETFLRGCTEYFKKFAFGNTTLADFFNSLQEQLLIEKAKETVNLLEFSD
jgi:aminopeptidase N